MNTDEKAVARVEDRGASLMMMQRTPEDLIKYQEGVAGLITKALKPGTDFGKIPGAGDKPTLLKPGAERVNLAFNCYPTYEIIASTADHDRRVEWKKRSKKWNNKFKGDHSFTWMETDGVSIGLYEYTVKCSLINRSTGEKMGDGLGSCSTMESKYIDRPRDCQNVVLKMAEKRAFIAVTLNVYGLSDRFTQDIEDYQEPETDHAPAPDKPAPEPEAKGTKETPFRAKLKAILKDQILEMVGDDINKAKAKFKEITGFNSFDEVPDNELNPVKVKVEVALGIHRQEKGGK